MRRCGPGRSARHARRHEPYPEFDPTPSRRVWPEDKFPDDLPSDDEVRVDIAALNITEESLLQSEGEGEFEARAMENDAASAVIDQGRPVVEAAEPIVQAENEREPEDRALEGDVAGAVGGQGRPAAEPMDAESLEVAPVEIPEEEAGPHEEPEEGGRSWYEQCIEQEEEERLQALHQAEQDERRRQESEIHAAAAEARRVRSEGAWFGPGSHTAEQLPSSAAPSSIPRRPPPQDRAWEERSAVNVTGAGPSASTGAIRRQRTAASMELEESRQAERELDRYLQARAPEQTAARPVVRVTPARAIPPTPWLPVPTSGWPAAPMEWDEEQMDAASDANRHADPPASQPRQRSVAPTTKGKKKQKRKPYNERRQMTMDDHHAAPSRSPSPQPGPNSLVRRVPAAAPAPAVPRRAPAAPRRAAEDRNNRPVRLRGVAFGGLAPIPTNPKIDPPGYVCFNCWQENHRAVNCPRPKTVYCHNCGRRGVDLASCPRCSEAHRQYLLERFPQKRREKKRAAPASSVAQRSCDRCGRRDGTRPGCRRCEGSDSSSSARSSVVEVERRQARDRAENRRREQRDGGIQSARARRSPSRRRDLGEQAQREPPRRSPSRRREIEPRPEAVRPRAQNVRERLGPRLERAPRPAAAIGEEVEPDRNAIQEALAIIQGIRDLPAATREDVLSYIYSRRHRSPSGGRGD